MSIEHGSKAERVLYFMGVLAKRALAKITGASRQVLTDKPSSLVRLP
jgi:hypothetical protein